MTILIIFCPAILSFTVTTPPETNNSTAAKRHRSDYAANFPNQDQQRTVPTAHYILDQTDAEAAVNVNGQTAQRLGKFFAGEVRAARNTQPASRNILITLPRADK